ncbi:hypothetical protein S100390_v1c03500 [Spiroplasma sp. NBRC 100390]|uniref:hypothetical protein n=1 Tax=unclassified Spiroplasma TaxID=2637901 RepID=UPI000892A288|nr:MULTISPECIES: hypothetical protein [unclassified Spiroplasma]AOX43693.1 hypothetical protein STU14_v1c03500 [Spiroplasma sp. TU-14]APE13163.1 hypothetical protein S100390_v1c03500 [Spiroplasma sp. NBRC 100390]
MRTFAKWSIALIWIIVLFILVLALAFLAVHYNGYYWEGKELPVNVKDIKTFDGNGYQLIAELGLGKVMRLATSGSFIWGYSNYVTVNGLAIDLMEWLKHPGSVINGVIQWPSDYEPEIGTNFATVTGSIVVALLVAIPVLSLVGFYITAKMVKAMTRPYSIEYLDAQKNLKKTKTHAKKALAKMTKAVKKGQEQPTNFAKEKEYWANLLDQAQAAFNKEKDLFKIKYNKKTTIRKINVIAGK